MTALFIRLAQAGNPTVLVPLIVPPSEVVIDSDVGRSRGLGRMSDGDPAARQGVSAC